MAEDAATADYACSLVTDETTRAGCLDVLEVVRREELHRAGTSVLESDVFDGADAPYELMAVRHEPSGQVVGTIRLTPAAALIGVEAAVVEYRLDTIGAELLTSTWILTRLALLPEVRGSTAGLELYGSLYRWALGQEVELLLLSCEPNLLPLYEWLGGRIYGTVHQGTRGGFRVPMVFVLHDREHFARVGSFIATIHDEVEPDERTRGREWFEQLAATGIHSGVRPFLDDPHSCRTLLTNGLSEAGCRQFLDKAIVVSTQPGDVVLAAGDGSRFVGTVLQGSVAVQIDGTVVDTLGPGSVFGELAFLVGGRRTADVVTRDPDTEVVLLSQHAYERLTEPADIRCAWRNLACVLAERVLARTTRETWR